MAPHSTSKDEQLNGGSPQHNDEATAAPKKHATPLPKKQMAALTVVLLSEPIGSTMLIPFVGLLAAHLTGVSPEEASYYSGGLTGLFMLGQLASGKLWGYLSDTYGRRWPLIAGLCMGTVAMLLFGVSPNIYICGLVRFFHGFFNGNVLVAKTIIADITDKTNEAKGFALISLTWGVGTLIGPAVGGFLYNPKDLSYMSWMHIGEDNILARFPALLPSLAIFAYNIIALVSSVFFVKETNMHCRKITFVALTKCCPWRKKSTANDVAVHDGDAEMVNTTSVALPDEGGGRQKRNPKIPIKHLTYVQAAKLPPIRNITILYMLLAASDMTYGQSFPLWGIAKRDVGGLGITPSKISILVLANSIPSIVANLLFHRACKLCGAYMELWRLAMFLYIAAGLVVPMGALMGPGGYWFVMLFGLIRQVGSSWAYSLVHMLTAKVAPFGCVGAVYGISQSSASAVRCVVPFIASSLFAWSISAPHPFPFNYSFTFVLSAVPTVVALWMAQYATILSPEPEDATDIVVVADKRRDGACAPSGDGNSDACDEKTASVSIEVSASVEEDSDSEHRSLYLSLAASFATNPVHSTCVTLVDMERINAEEHGVKSSSTGSTAGEVGDEGVEAPWSGPSPS